MNETACALREPADLKPCGVENSPEDQDMLLGQREVIPVLSAKVLGHSLHGGWQI